MVKAMSIREAANYMGIAIDTIKYWEKIGIIKPERNKRGWRIFTIEDIQELKKIKSGPYFKKEKHYLERTWPFTNSKKEGILMKRVLVVDDDVAICSLFSRILTARGCKVVTVESGSEALDKIKEKPFDIVFLDIVMAGIDGLKTLRTMRMIDPEIEVVIMSGQPIEKIEKEVKESLSLGVKDFLRKPFNIAEVVEKMLQERPIKVVEDKKASILVVDDDVTICNLFSQILSTKGYEVVTVESGSEALDKIKEKPFDIVFLDIVMAGIDGLKTLRTMRMIDPEIEVVIMSGQPIEKIEKEVKESLSLGVKDFLRKPFNIAEVVEKMLLKKGIIK